MKKTLTAILLMWALGLHAQPASAYDVVIDEIMADPSPAVALPNNEFIELRNVSAHAFNLNGWRVGDATGFATIATNFILKPDSFVIICAGSAAMVFAHFGPTIAVSNFPSLNNDGDQLYLQSKEGRIIHAVAYSSDWYKNAVKSQGGWTLEMIDTRNPCSGFSNWTASNDPSGGTPGKKNSVDAVNTDTQLPVLVRAYAADSLNIIVTFDEPLDSLGAADAGNYNINNGIGTPSQAVPLPPFFTIVQLRCNTAVTQNSLYTITVNHVTDCSGNAIGAYNHTRLGLAVAAMPFDVVINELLFNPRPDGADYIELYNRGHTIVDLMNCYLASRRAGSIESVKQISVTNRLLFPGDYVVITDNVSAVQRQYLAKDPAAFAAIAAMPAYADDTGDALLLNAQGDIIDELAYDEHWQFKLLNNKEGVALERIDYNKPTQDAANWHSAATSAGYGTPGYQNSEFKADGLLQGSITVTPAVFSPDNDGFNDFLTIDYHFPDQGYVCNITVFDAQGRPVRFVTRNALCGLQGYFRWDGLDEKGGKLPIGVYVLLTDVFNLKGKTAHFKQAVTLARRLN